MTTAIEAELSQANQRLLDMVLGTPNESLLNQGLSAVVRNRVTIALAHPQGLEYLSYGEGDSVDSVRARLQAAGEWLIQVAKEAK